MSNVDETSENDHAKLYKNSAKSDVNDSRRRRTENSIEIRRQKRNDEIMKRRNLDFELINDANEELQGNDTNDENEKQQGPVWTIQQIVHVLMNNPPLEKLREAFLALRRMLSRTQDPPVDEVIQAGLVDALVKALAVDDERVQFETAWALTNIVSGTSEQTLFAVNAGVTRPLIQLSHSSSPKLAEQAIWALANIVGESVELRDHVVQEGVIPILVERVSMLSSLSKSFVRTLAWTYSNMVRHKHPQLPIDVLRHIIPGLRHLLDYDDLPCMVDACWAFCFLTDGVDEVIELVAQHNIVERVIGYLRSDITELIAPSLRVLGNFATGNDMLTQLVVNSGILDPSMLLRLLRRSSTSIVKECCWLVSNVVAGTHSQIQCVLDTEIIPIILDVLKEGEYRCQFEAAWVIANIVHGGKAQQVLQIASYPTTIETICVALTIKNNEIVMNMLESLFGILCVVSEFRPQALRSMQDKVEESHGLDYLETLQQHEAEQIYILSYRIVEKFFSDDEDTENLDITSDLLKVSTNVNGTNPQFDF